MKAIADLIESPGGVYFFRDEAQRKFLPVAVWPEGILSGMDLPDLPIDSALAEFLARTQWVVDIHKHARLPALYDNLSMPASLTSLTGVRAILPIIELSQLVGLVVLQAPPEPFEMTYEDHDLLKTVGGHVATYVAQQRADEQLTAGRQFEAFNRLVGYAMHDLKNSAAQLRLMSSNARQHRSDPAFIDDMLVTVDNVSQRVTRLIEAMTRRQTSSIIAPCKGSELLDTAAQRCMQHRPVPVLHIECCDEQVPCDREQFVAALEHVIRNAQDATPASGSVAVRLRRLGALLEFRITDTGMGISREFIRQHLFKPFDSTKGSKGMVIGAH